MSRCTPPLTVLFFVAPDPDPEGPGRDIVDLLAQALASKCVEEARTEAEPRLGRPFAHATTEPTVLDDPLHAWLRRMEQAP